MKNALLILLGLFFCGCATLETAGLENVQRYVEKRQYKQALYRIEDPFRGESKDPEISAGYEYWRARAYEGQGRTDEAIGVYKFVREQYRETKWGKEAEERLKALR